MKRLMCVFVSAVLALAVVPSAFAKTSYLYRHRADWVKLVQLSSKQLAGQVLAHPSADISAEEMESMLMSIQMNRKSLLKKDIDDAQVFSSFEARRFAPYIIQALNQASPNEVVNVSIVHKRPTFILRNDYVSNVNVFVTNDGVHFFFNKLFARLDGDYAQMSNVDEALQKAKTMRVTLDAGPGQQLSFNNPLHVVLERSHDFADDVTVKQETAKQENEDSLKPKSQRQAKVGKTAAPTDDTEEFQDKAPVSSTPVPSTTTTASSGGNDAASRLRKLETLKQQKLISDQEYQRKRQEILDSI